ncbi:MAG: methionyl-tRNA formyltransferase [Clostridia bacterium]|nr:methionyl-tRNA formyltransferase [Clostridia bacterium]
MGEDGRAEPRAVAEEARREALALDPLPILCEPDPALRRAARPVKRVTRRVRELALRMASAMYRANGVGLAATQVGAPERLFVADVGEGLRVFVNPEILAASEETATAWEGCLSLPGLLGEVERARRVRVTALDERGRRFWLDAEGELARVIQHESDHLDGVLVLDRAKRVLELPPESRLKVAFFGTPGFAAKVLEGLVEAGVRPRLVVTRPDRPRGRGRRLQPTPVRETAEAMGIETWTPARPGDPALLREIRLRDTDVLVTVAYGRILPPELLRLPKLAAVNLHPSLLPRWRGPAPIQRAILAGDRVTGVTVMHMAEEVDAGDILLQREVPIEPDDDFGRLHDRLAEAGAEALVLALRSLASGEAPRRPQDAGAATWAPALRPEDEWLDWREPAEAVRNRVRALTPWPGAKCRRGDEVWVVRRAEVDATAAAPAAPPGAVLAVDPGRGVLVACGAGAVWITELKPAGRRAMPAADYLRGHRVEVGERLLADVPREAGRG